MCCPEADIGHDTDVTDLFLLSHLELALGRHVRESIGEGAEGWGGYWTMVNLFAWKLHT